MMENFIQFIYLISLPIILIVFLFKILKQLEKLNKKENTETKVIRKHPSIEKSNYDNAFGGRKAYEIYKNRDGLYEPITPSRGIKIKKEE